MPTVQDTVSTAERRATLRPGAGERFSGWGLMGLPFASGDVLATRTFSATSIGPGYHAVWHRDPEGRWNFYLDVEPALACSRFFGAALSKSVQCPVTIEWTGPDSLHIEVQEAGLSCDLEVGPTLASRTMNAMASTMPEATWRSPTVLRLMSAMGGTMLGAGHLAMAGNVPNGQAFIANPRKVWLVKNATLRVDGRTSQPGPVHPQAQLGDFFIPQRGILAIGNSAFDAFDAQRHSSAVSIAT